MSGNEAQDPPGYDYNGDGVVSWTETLLSIAEIGGYAFDIATFPSGEGAAFGVFLRGIGKQIVQQGGRKFVLEGGKKILIKGSDDIVDLVKFTRVKGGNLSGPKNWHIESTRGIPHVEGGVYKLYHNGNRVATLNKAGKILGK